MITTLLNLLGITLHDISILVDATNVYVGCEKFKSARIHPWCKEIWFVLTTGYTTSATPAILFCPYFCAGRQHCSNDIRAWYPCLGSKETHSCLDPKEAKRSEKCASGKAPEISPSLDPKEVKNAGISGCWAANARGPFGLGSVSSLLAGPQRGRVGLGRQDSQALACGDGRGAPNARAWHNNSIVVLLMIRTLPEHWSRVI